MNAQQLLDCIIVPTLKHMGGNYNSKDAQMLLLATAAIESKCGYYIKQIGGPALGIWQMEPSTEKDIFINCDAVQDNSVLSDNIGYLCCAPYGMSNLLASPMYACAMARLKYSMDADKLPDYRYINAIYYYYKRIYNTPLGASTYSKFTSAWDMCDLDNVELR